MELYIIVSFTYFNSRAGISHWHLFLFLLIYNIYSTRHSFSLYFMTWSWIFSLWIQTSIKSIRQIQHRKFFMSCLASTKKNSRLFFFSRLFFLIFLFFFLLNYILVWQKGHRHGASSSSIRTIHTVIENKRNYRWRGRREADVKKYIYLFWWGRKDAVKVAIQIFLGSK